MFKKYFGYTEIGIISYWTLPYSIKFLFAPVVDCLFIKSLGKRRSWILPSQILTSILLYILSLHLEEFINERKIFMLTASLFVVILWCAIQDIAVDGWWVTIVKPENLVHAGSAQLIGLEIGGFISTTVFIALNSVEFWNNYIYSIPHSEPILNEISYMKGWAVIFILVSFYTYLFIDEKNDRVKLDDLEVPSIKSCYIIVLDMIKNKQLQITFWILLSLRMFSLVNEYIGKIHLIDDLHYSQSKFSIILLISFPLSLIASTLIAKLSHINMIYVMVFFTLLKWLNDIFMINVVFYYITDGFYYDIFLCITIITQSCITCCIFSAGALYGNSIVDPRIASTQLTFFNSMQNTWYNIPKIYTFLIVDRFGVYIPNFVMWTFGIIVWLLLLKTSNNSDLHKKLDVDENHFKSD